MHPAKYSPHFHIQAFYILRYLLHLFLTFSFYSIILLNIIIIFWTFLSYTTWSTWKPSLFYHSHDYLLLHHGLLSIFYHPLIIIILLSHSCFAPTSVYFPLLLLFSLFILTSTCHSIHPELYLHIMYAISMPHSIEGRGMSINHMFVPWKEQLVPSKNEIVYNLMALCLHAR